MVHIYKGAEVVITLNYEFSDFKPYWYYEWEEGMSAYPEKFLHPLVGEDGTLREMTREELVKHGIEIPLSEGEVIEKGELKKEEKPDSKMYWKWNGSEWVYDVSKEEEEYFKLIGTYKEQAMSKGFEIS